MGIHRYFRSIFRQEEVIHIVFSLIEVTLIFAAVAVVFYFVWQSNTMSVELPLRRFTDLEQPTLTIRNPAGSIRIRGARTSDVEVRGKQRVLRSYWHVIPSMLNCYREGNTITITIDRQWEHDPPVSGIDVTTPFFCLSHIDAFRALNWHAHDKSGPMAVCYIHT